MEEWQEKTAVENKLLKIQVCHKPKPWPKSSRIQKNILFILHAEYYVCRKTNTVIHQHNCNANLAVATSYFGHVFQQGSSLGDEYARADWEKCKAK